MSNNTTETEASKGFSIGTNLLVEGIQLAEVTNGETNPSSFEVGGEIEISTEEINRLTDLLLVESETDQNLDAPLFDSFNNFIADEAGKEVEVSLNELAALSAFGEESKIFRNNPNRLTSSSVLDSVAAVGSRYREPSDDASDEEEGENDSKATISSLSPHIPKHSISVVTNHEDKITLKLDNVGKTGVEDDSVSTSEVSVSNQAPDAIQDALDTSDLLASLQEINIEPLDWNEGGNREEDIDIGSALYDEMESLLHQLDLGDS